MNPMYYILESPNRWAILGGLAFGAGFIGAIMIITYGWPQWFARVWILAGLIGVLYCAVRWILQWKAQVDAMLAAGDVSERRESENRPA